MKKLTYDEIQIGQSADYTRTITEADIQRFADVSGDHNPLHLDESFARTTFFKGRIAHGMLSASFISTVLAMKLPGAGSVYLKQEVNFLKPVRIGDTITTRVEVLNKDDQNARITLKTTCTNQDGIVVVDGNAIVMVMRL
ncbi:MAG: MaoC family dehydratase [Candidatus Heimdallarchaeota archaeon]